MTSLTIIALFYSTAMLSVPNSNPSDAVMTGTDTVVNLLLAQQKPSTVRPPVPSIKTLKKINRSPGKNTFSRTGGRVNPTKPTLRPKAGQRAPLFDRKKIRGASGAKNSGRPMERKIGTSSRKLKTIGQHGTTHDSKSTTAVEKNYGPKGSNSTGNDSASSGDLGSASIKDKDKKCRPLPRRVKVRMNFNEAEVLEIVQWISEQTCKNFIIGDNIRGGKITILSNTPVTADEAYRAFLSALNVNNMTVVRVGKFYKIQMKRDAAKDTIPTFIGDDVNMPNMDMMVTRLVQLKYIDANTVNGTVKQLTSKDGDSYPYAPTNTLIVSDTASNMHRIMEILGQLDTPMGQEEIRVIQVEFAVATELAQTLEEIFGQKGGRSGGKSTRSHSIRPARGKPAAKAGEMLDEEGVSVSKIIPDERTNQLIVVATARSFARVQELIDKIDIPIPGEGQIQVVYLEHADAEELANTLTSLSQGTGVRHRSTKSKSTKTRGPAKAAELFQGDVKVTADKATNSLVIVASQNDFRSLQKVIRKLDIARRQVFVEAVIMEVNMDTSRDVGLAFHAGAAANIAGETVPLIFGSQFKTQGQNINSLSVVPNLSMLGFLSGLRGPDMDGTESILGSISLPSFGVVLQALQTDSNVDVLSTPHILTSDNEEAQIQVGENIPIPAGYGGGISNLMGLASLAGGAGSTGATSGYGAYGSRLGGLGGLGGFGLGMGMGAINRQEVGLTLKIKPQINEGDYIRMELEEELSEVKDTSNPLGPTTTKRSAKTVVVVKDQQTVVIGGLMRDKIDIGETKIPLLGDIPVIGWLFRSKKQQKTKTNLLLFLTPYVIESQEDFRAIFERKIRERREFMERFYGHGRQYEAFIDFRRKHGPMADIHMHLRQELSKIENGGKGSGTEVLITPISTKTPTGDMQKTDGTGDKKKNFTGSDEGLTGKDTESSPADTQPDGELEVE